MFEFLQLAAQQRQPPQHKENNGLALPKEEETDSFLPDAPTPSVECETSV